MSRYIVAHDHFNQVFSHISTSSDRCWGEKAGYKANCLHGSDILPIYVYTSDQINI